MKKQYVMPVAEVVEIKSPQLMLSVSGEQSGVGKGDGSVGNNTPDLAKQKHGTWGNLWE